MTKNQLTNEIPYDILLDFLSEHELGVAITIKVKPNCTKEKLSLYGIDQIVLSVRTAAIENAANLRVEELLATFFSLPRSKVKIISGHRSRVKRILLVGQNLEQLLAQ